MVAVSVDSSSTSVLISMLVSYICSSGRANGMVIGMEVSVIVSVSVRLLMLVVEKYGFMLMMCWLSVSMIELALTPMPHFSKKLSSRGSSGWVVSAK